MITASTYRRLAASVTLGAFFGFVSAAGSPAWAANTRGGNTIQPDQMRASQMIGDDVYNMNDQSIGHVVDIVLDPNGQVAGVVIGVAEPAGGGEKNVSVPMGDIHSDHNHLTLNRTKDQLQQAQDYHLEGANMGSGTSTQPAQGGAHPSSGQNTPAGK